MNIRKYTFLFFLIFTVRLSLSQTIVDPSPIKWYTVEEADSLFKLAPKPFLIDVYTDWCGWCKHMMKTTFAHQGIASYINMHFYPVRFNAESFDTVHYNNKEYINNGVGNKPKHELANFLMKGRFSFPTIVYIDKNRNVYPIPGYMKIKEIEPLLVYFSEEINLNLKYDDWNLLYLFNYSKNYEEEISKIDSVKYPDTTGIVNWMSFKDATESSLKDNKSIFIFIYTDWCQSCKVLSGVVYKNPVIAQILNANFYPVYFNAASQENEIFFGEEVGGNGLGNPHKLTYALLQQSFQFPAYIIMNSKKQKLTELHGFMSSYQLETFLSYFLNENYKKQTFEDFVKTFKGKLTAQ